MADNAAALDDGVFNSRLFFEIPYPASLKEGNIHSLNIYFYSNYEQPTKISNYLLAKLSSNGCFWQQIEEYNLKTI